MFDSFQAFSASARRSAVPDRAALRSLACLILVFPVLLSWPQFPLSIMGQGTAARPAQGGHLRVLPARSPGGPRRQLPLVTDISPQLVSEGAEQCGVLLLYSDRQALRFVTEPVRY